MGHNFILAMGRVKIPMAYRTDDRARRVTLCKRKKGLYKKAEELAKLCGVEVAVVIVGDSCHPSQHVSTGSGEYQDIPSACRVLSKYQKTISSPAVLSPADLASEAAAVLEKQQVQLEQQRRQIEELTQKLDSVKQTGSCSSRGVLGYLGRCTHLPNETGGQPSMDDSMHMV